MVTDPEYRGADQRGLLADGLRQFGVDHAGLVNDEQGGSPCSLGRVRSAEHQLLPLRCLLCAVVVVVVVRLLHNAAEKAA